MLLLLYFSVATFSFLFLYYTFKIIKVLVFLRNFISYLSKHLKYYKIFSRRATLKSKLIGVLEEKFDMLHNGIHSIAHFQCQYTQKN